MDEDAALTEVVIGAANKGPHALGPGLLQSAVEACVAHELTHQGLPLRRQVECPVHYDGLLRNAPVGLLLDLNTVLLTDGFHRVINVQAPRPPGPPRFNQPTHQTTTGPS